MTEQGILERALRGALGEKSLVSTTVSFADLIWDGNVPTAEIVSLDPAVVLDAISSPRRIVLQHVRGEIRYWLTSQRDPYLASRSSDGELGVVPSLSDAITLCEEFLVEKHPIESLRTPRVARRFHI